MDVMQRLLQVQGSLTASEEKVCRLVIEHPEIVEWTSITRLAAEAETSVSAVQRLCRDLGYAGYKEFRSRLIMYLASEERDAATPDAVSALAASLSEAVAQLADCDRTLLDELAQDIVDARVAYCIGAHRSGLVAEKLRMNLEDQGIVAVSSRSPMQSRHYLSCIREDTIVILFSVSGGSAVFRELFEDESMNVGRIWSVTLNGESWLAQHANRSIVLPRPLASKRGAMDEHAVMVAYVEIITLAVHEILMARSRGAGT